MTDPHLHYLSVNPINDPKIFVIIPTYNEEENVESVIKDYKNQKFVEEVVIVDNHSSDRTVELSKSCGATVITKDENKGFADSCSVGMQESLKSNSNIVVFTECERTYSANDLEKM